MRTTLNIAEDVLLAARERSRRERRPLGDVISDLARIGLSGPVSVGEVAEPEPFYGFRPLPYRGETVSNALIDKLREEEPE